MYPSLRLRSRIPSASDGGLQYSCLGYAMDRAVWQATVIGLQSRTSLKRLSSHIPFPVFLVPLLKRTCSFCSSVLSFSFLNLLAVPRGTWGLSFPTRDRTCACCIGILATGLPGRSLSFFTHFIWGIGLYQDISSYLVLFHSFMTSPRCGCAIILFV